MSFKKAVSRRLVSFLALGFGFQGTPQIGELGSNCLPVLSAEVRVLAPTISEGSRPELDGFVWHPLEVYEAFKSKMAAAKKINPDKPYSFSVSDVFSPLLGRLLSQIEVAEFQTDVNPSKAAIKEAVSFKTHVLKWGREIQNKNIPYDEFINWTRAYSLLMSVKKSLTQQGQLHKIQYSGADIKSMRLSTATYDVVNEMEPSGSLPFFLFPTDAKLTEIDFLRTRGVPIYFLGMTDQLLHADGINFSPFDYWIHDLKDHAKMFLAADQKMFSKERFIRARSAEFSALNKKWALFLDTVDRWPDEQKRSALVELLFDRLHEFGWSLNRIAEVLKLARERGLLPPHMSSELESLFQNP